MLWLAIAVHWLHVFFATFWFGSNLFMFAVMSPSLKAVDPPAALEVAKQLGLRLTRVFAPVGGLTILFGLINAIAFGPVKSLDFLWSSPYGVTITVALVLAIALAAFGASIGRIGMSIATAPEAMRPQLLARIVRMNGTMVLGFVVILICMVLMRYGL